MLLLNRRLFIAIFRTELTRNESEAVRHSSVNSFVLSRTVELADRTSSGKIDIADADSHADCFFGANARRFETIAAGSAHERLCISASSASGRQHRAAFDWIGAGGQSG